MVASMEGKHRRKLTFEEVAALMTEREGKPIAAKTVRAVHSLAMKKLRARFGDTLLERMAHCEGDPDDEG